MRTINISISDSDFLNYGFNSENLLFSELEKMIQKRTIKNALYTCQKIAEKEGLSKMTLAEINKEIQSVREEMQDNT